jgi:uncharacterized protein YihD (DUF1040 family)
MRDPKRIKRILELIQNIWEQHPDLRLCQLIGNVFPGDNYHIEDDDLEKQLLYQYNKLDKIECLSDDCMMKVERLAGLHKIEDKKKCR